MNARLLLDAIEGIGDSYVTEFAAIKQKRKMIWRCLAAAAACVCLILTAALTYPKEDQPGVEPTMPEGNVIWGSAFEDIWVESSGQARPGEVVLAPKLEEAFAQSENPSDIFAIRVEETTGAAPEQIYEEFIKPLGIYEEYLDKGVIFATQEQAKGISVPDAFGVVLDLALELNDNDCPEPDIETTAPVANDEAIAQEKTDGNATDNRNTVIDIVDLTEEEGMITLTALELFYEDGAYAYYFPSIKSDLVYVKYADHTQKKIKEALVSGDVTIQDLDRFGILYYKESLSADTEVTEPPERQEEEATEPPDHQEEVTVPPNHREEIVDNPSDSNTGDTANLVIDIVDLTEEEGMITLTALELFYEDGEYAYYFPSIKSDLVYVKYADQTQKKIKEALASGDVTIQDLDRFGIQYFKESLPVDTEVTEPPHHREEEVTEPPSHREEIVDKPPDSNTGDTAGLVIDIVDLTEEEGMITLTALELFYEDGAYAYYFPSIKSDLVYVKYADQTQKKIKEALASGDVTIQDLDRFGILYFKESLTTEQ